MCLWCVGYCVGFHCPLFNVLSVNSYVFAALLSVKKPKKASKTDLWSLSSMTRPGSAKQLWDGVR